MEKRYNVFIEDVKCIEEISAEIKYYSTILKRIRFYHPIKRKNLNKKVERELNKLNNHKINLIRKISFIKLNELIKILEQTDGLELAACKSEMPGNHKSVMESIIIIDKFQDNGIILLSNDHLDEYKISKVSYRNYSKIEKNVVDTLYLTKISKAVIINSLISFDDDELFQNFINSYIDYLNNVFECAGI